MKLVITCEHGGNTIPEEYKLLFPDNTVLETHRGYDLGALDAFNYLQPLADYSNYSTTSRLLIELNRSLLHKNLYSEFSKKLPINTKKQIIKKYYTIYRSAVSDYIEASIKNNNAVIHLSIHSFTPQLNQEIRNCDIGLLFDSRKVNEKEIAVALKKSILAQNPNYRIRFNYPYLGKADGFTTTLRKQFPEHYSGIEIEINQSFSNNNTMPESIKTTLKESILKI
ncbi:N-formylglutamate amidohydrolase [Psychroserpens sp. NJDZ02]|uniref:N-formylglutamate amidohydrolase n=1 Tax=Psychroserpens sp. NJDZ02 TaxID=2570561 RepID=UPI0010A7D8DC|nr:N-formylglutamate amidohydrolase [Psychroserpens sp. NJDZ02]QCE41761.1 N-formylglutamate amidohydrolase [Psychroserpens sp. NJDZ02]